MTDTETVETEAPDVEMGFTYTVETHETATSHFAVLKHYPGGGQVRMATTGDFNQANRIAATLNACEGISTKELEAGELTKAGERSIIWMWKLGAAKDWKDD